MRNALLAKIHIAKKELGLDEEAYRAVLERVVKKRSAGKCTDNQLKKVLEEFKDRGWSGGNKKRKYRSTNNTQVKKVYALWGELQSMGVIRNKDKTALDTFVKRMTRVDNVNWLGVGEANKVIEALKGWIERELDTISSENLTS